MLQDDNKGSTSFEELAMCKIPNCSSSMLCYAWMKYFFNLVGDFTPNKDEIHLESQSIKEVRFSLHKCLTYYSQPYIDIFRVF